MERFLKKDVTGAVMMLFSASCFSLMALFVRLASETIPVGMIVCVRYGFTVLIFLPPIFMHKVRIRPVNHRLLLYRSVSAGFGGLFFFLAISSITIAEAVILKYTFPIFAVTISALFYGEKTSRMVIILLLWSFAGVYVMMNPKSFDPHIGYLWGMLNALSAGAAVAFVRKLRATDDSWTIMFFTAVAGMVISLPLLTTGLRMPDAAESMYLLFAGVFGLLAQFALVYGFRYIKTGAASVIMMIEVVIASLLGFVILGQVPSIHQVLGGCMILFGGALVLLYQGQRKEG